MDVKCVVSAVQSDGIPSFYACIIRCLDSQYQLGEHYDEAKMQALGAGYEQCGMVYDENDGPPWLFKQFEWHDMKPVDVGTGC